MLRLLGLLAFGLIASGCSTPDFQFRTIEQDAIVACRDGALSDGEADVDCGLTCATPCVAGKTCTLDGDCASGLCSKGVCQTLSCTDQLQNQSETDIDCGGETGCARCQPGQACKLTSDCSGGACTSGMCAAPSCADQLHNQTESDVDCGGPCAPCATGKTCNTKDDCDLAACTAGKCRAQTCSDGITNQDESDVDCGGNSGCARCATHQQCSTTADCDRAQCSKGSCQGMGCDDGVKNDTETDVDCGGDCKACAALASCEIAQDCESKVCSVGTLKCAAPTCNDGVLNGSEPTLDCGASCTAKCALADVCATAADCASKRCFNAHCAPTAPTNMPLASTDWIGSASNTYQSDTAPRFALDGNAGTHWTNGGAQVPGMWFAVDMVKPQIFFSVTVTTNSQPTDYGKTLRLSGSLDGVIYTQLRTGIAGEQDLKISFSDPQYARYLKLELVEVRPGLWWCIDDLRVLQ